MTLEENNAALFEACRQASATFRRLAESAVYFHDMQEADRLYQLAKWHEDFAERHKPEENDGE